MWPHLEHKRLSFVRVRGLRELISRQFICSGPKGTSLQEYYQLYQLVLGRDGTKTPIKMTSHLNSI